MMRLLEMHHLFALNTSSVLPEQMMCFFYILSHQKKNRRISLKFAQISRPNSRNIPTICARSINLSLGLRRATI